MSQNDKPVQDRSSGISLDFEEIKRTVSHRKQLSALFDKASVAQLEEQEEQVEPFNFKMLWTAMNTDSEFPISLQVSPETALAIVERNFRIGSLVFLSFLESPSAPE